MQSKQLVGFLFVVAIVGGTAFYGGSIYAKRGSNDAVSARGANFRLAAGGIGGPGGAAAGASRNVGGFIGGEVISKDATSVTIKMRDGGSKVVYYSGSTTVSRMASGSMDDVAPGVQVTITGTPNTDGSVAATMMQIRPAEVVSPVATPDTNAQQAVVTANNFTYDLTAMTAKKGQKIQIKLKNIEGTHDLKIDEFHVATAKMNAGEETLVEFTPDKTGTFEYYCSVGNHRAMGMKGTLTVTE
jgi:plastocyanin